MRDPERRAEAAMRSALGGRSGLAIVATPERDKALIDSLAARSVGMS